MRRKSEEEEEETQQGFYTFYTTNERKREKKGRQTTGLIFHLLVFDSPKDAHLEVGGAGEKGEGNKELRAPNEQREL